MSVFQEMLGVAAAIAIAVVGSIMLLTLFFKVLSWFSRESLDKFAVGGVLKKETWVAVHLQGEEKFERVRIVGYTTQTTSSGNTQLPWELSSMVILEDESGKKFIVRAKLIRLIVIEPEAQQENL